VVSGVEPDTSGTVVREKWYYLPRHVHACRTDEGIIFLDARHDRYFGLGGAGVTALTAFVTNWPDAQTGSRQDTEDSTPHAEVQRIAEGLIQRGLLCHGCDNESTIRRIVVPPLSMERPIGVEEARHALRLVDLIYFTLACLQAVWLLKRQPLGVIASRVTAARHKEESPDLTRLFAHVQTFRRLRRLFFSEKDRCLLNALALVIFLRHYGHFPLFVIGVKGRPFGAHSWVQHDRLLLDGDPASVCHFVPILGA
jgi:hypothetical protein